MERDAWLLRQALFSRLNSSRSWSR